MSRPVCEGIRKDGGPCKAPRLPDSALCWSHDPRQSEQAVRARAEGASKGGQLRALQGRRRRLDSPAAVVGFLSNLVHDVADGRVEGEVAKVLVYALSVQLKAVELAEAAQGRRLLDQVGELTRQAKRAQ
jgi:hypothetical protein